MSKYHHKIQKEILNAIYTSNIDAVLRCIEETPSILNKKFNDKGTLLHIAVNRNDINMVSFLLDNNIDPNLGDGDGRRPIALSISKGHVNIFNLLLDHPSVDLLVVDNHERTLMDYAVVYNFTEIIKILLDKGHKVNPHTLIENPNDSLVLLCTPDDREFVKQDLNKILLSNIEDCLPFAIECDNMVIVKLLTDNDLSRTIDIILPNINEARSELYDAINASKLVRTTVLLKVLELNNYVFDNDIDFLEIIEHYIDEYHVEMFELLYSWPLYRKAIERVINIDYPLLHRASDSYQDEEGTLFQRILDIWLDLGHSINTEDKSGTTPLYLAVKKDNTKIVKILIENGADPNIQGEYGIYPIFLACKEASDETFECLLDSELFDVKLTNKNDHNVFYYAIMHNRYEILERLINKGFNVNMVYIGTKETPLLFAIKYSSPIAADILIEHGSSVRYSHLMAALDRQDYDIFSLLWDNLTITLTAWQLHNLLTLADSTSVLIRLINHDLNTTKDIINTECRDYFMQTILHKVIYRIRNIDFIRKCLFKLEAIDSINVVNIHGNTPLHVAAMYSTVEIIQLLLDCNSDRTIKNVFKNTPAQSATYYNRKDIASFIETYDSTLDIKCPYDD